MHYSLVPITRVIKWVVVVVVLGRSMGTSLRRTWEINGRPAETSIRECNKYPAWLYAGRIPFWKYPMAVIYSNTTVPDIGCSNGISLFRHRHCCAKPPSCYRFIESC